MTKRVSASLTLEQLKALASPIRHDIVDRLAAMGPLSVSALARSLGRKPTAIYRHLVGLEQLGLIAASSVGGSRGRPAMIYRLATQGLRLAAAPKVKNNRAPMAKMANAMARQAAREYAAAFDAGGWVVEGPKRNHGFFELITSPSPKRLAMINALLDDLTRLMWMPDTGPGRPMRVTWFMSPSSKGQAKSAKTARTANERSKARPREEVGIAAASVGNGSVHGSGGRARAVRTSGVHHAVSA